jgi:hypothetical protein
MITKGWWLPQKKKGKSGIPAFALFLPDVLSLLAFQCLCPGNDFDNLASD